MALPHETGGAIAAIIHYKRPWLETELASAAPDQASNKAAALAGLRPCVCSFARAA
jgi:hypothetical protein